MFGSGDQELMDRSGIGEVDTVSCREHLHKNITFRAVVAVLFACSLLLAAGCATVGPARTFQTIATEGADNWEHFTIGADHYLAVANRYDGKNFKIDSKIYKWDAGLGSFVFFQNLATTGAKKISYFSIGPDHFLAVANQYDGTRYSIHSKIFKWNGSSFVSFSLILTQECLDIEFFTIGSDSFLAFANGYDDKTGPKTNSRIYKWNGSNFVLFQTIATLGATDWEHFTIGTDHYLAVANQHDATSDFSINSVIYKYDGVDSFDQFQTIASDGAYDWQHFVIGSDTYLALANNNQGEPIQSKIYKYNGTTNFDLFQSIDTLNATDWEHFRHGKDNYLLLANGSEYSNKLYKWNGSSFVLQQDINNSGGRVWTNTFFEMDGGDYFAAAIRKDGKSWRKNSIIYNLR